MKELFINFEDIEFHIINRRILKNYNSDNINTYEDCPTLKMMEIIKKSHYILIEQQLFNSKGEIYL